MKRLAGQAGRTIGGFFHHLGMLVITLFFVFAVLFGGLAYRLSRGPLQIPWLTTVLANAVSGADIDIHVGQAALAWEGYRKGGGAPLYLQLGAITVRESGAALAAIPNARLELSPSVFFSSRAAVKVTSTDATLQGGDVPVALQAAIHFRGLALSEADLAVTLGAGQLGPPGLAEKLAGGRFMLALTPKTATLTNGEFTLAPSGGSAPVLHVAGSAQRSSFWHGTLNLTGNAVQAQDLPVYWPDQLAPQTRSWVLKNITAGTADAPDFTFTFSAPGGLGNPRLDNATGHFQAQELSLTWIPAARPITQLTGRFTLTDPDDIDIAADSAMLGGIRLGAATMHIAGVAHRDQTGTLHIPISSTIPEALAVLNAPPLNLLKMVPPPVLAATGNMTGTVDVVVPFKKVVTIEDVTMRVATALTEVAIPLQFNGLLLTQGELSAVSTTKTLDIAGKAALAGEPASLKVAVDYGPKNVPATVKLDMQTSVTARTLTALGLDPNASISGSMPLDIGVVTTAANIGKITVNADLTPAGVKLPIFGWSKPAGKPGRLNFAASIDGQGSGINRIDSIDASAPGLDIETAAADGGINLTHIHIGNTDGSGRIVPPAGANAPWRIDLFGTMLDASAAINPPPPAVPVKPVRPAAPVKPAPPPPPTPPSGFLWQATAHFDGLRLAVPPAAGLTNFNFEGTGQGGSVFTATSNVLLGTGAPVDLTVAAGAGALPGYVERLQMHTVDGGELLREMGAYSDLSGGKLDFAADYGAATLLTGTATITNFRLMNAPAFAKFLQAITLLGIPEAASGPGLEFSRLVAPFSVDGGVLTLKGSRAYSASLGFTASGTIDLNQGLYNIHGTVVPAYALNALPGKIPIIGKLFSPEKGGGLFAMRYSMTGTTADPKVHVNPFSALTPGFLRGIFGLGDKTDRPTN